MPTLTPTQRAALTTARDHGALRRCRGGFTGDTHVTAVHSVRTVNALQRDGLLQFVPPQYPAHALLTAAGRAAIHLELAA